MRKLIAVIIVAAALPTASASAQVIVSPAPTHHHVKKHGYLYFSEARLRTVQVVKKFARHHEGVYVVGACHRNSRLAVNCDVARSYNEQDTATVCDYVSRVRKRIRGRSVSWSTRLDISGRGCHLA